MSDDLLARVSPLEVPRPRGADTSFEVELDDPPATRDPVYVDVTSRDHELMPIVPAWARSRAGIAEQVSYHTHRWGHITGVHAFRSPLYAWLALWYAPLGAAKLAWLLIRWWWDLPTWRLEQEHATNVDQLAFNRARQEGNERRKFRGTVLLLLVLALVVGVWALRTYAPLWAQLLVIACAVPPLAHYGHRPDRPIVRSAVVTQRYRKLNSDIVLRAYYAAGLGDPDKHPVTFGSTMSRDGSGSRVVVNLDYGYTLDDALKGRPKIASGLDVAASQVFITRDPTSHRAHTLWVADQDPLALPAGRTPLLACRPTDIWQPAPFGLDERGNRISVPILWNSILIGAQPRQGKTFSARALALYAALDPYCRVTVLDAGGKPDWRKFSLVADRFAFGLAMTRQGDPVEIVLDTLRAIKADVQRRYETLSSLPASICPEGKLTREIARDPRYGIPVHVVFLDEFQEYFDLGDASKELGSLLVYLVKVAPAAGVSLIDATQRPSGVGTGQVAQQFISFRDNHQVRFSLRTGSWQVSDLVLGAGAYSEGHDSSTLLPTYKGVGILRGAGDETPTVRTYLADQEDAEKILTAARALRERAGTLSGMAAGEDVTRQARDVLRDVDSVFYAGEAWISWEKLAARLAEVYPEVYAGLTKESISAQVRGLRVEATKGRDGKATLWGVPHEHVAQAIKLREIEGLR